MYHCPEVVSHAFSHGSESLTILFLRKINVLGLFIAENPRNQRPTPIQDPIWGRGPSRISQAKRIGMALIMLGAKDHMYLHTRFQGIYPGPNCVREFWFTNLWHEPCLNLKQNTDSGPEIWLDRSEKVASQRPGISWHQISRDLSNSVGARRKVVHKSVTESDRIQVVTSYFAFTTSSLRSVRHPLGMDITNRQEYFWYGKFIFV